MKKIYNIYCINILVRISETAHTAHDTENVVVSSIDTDLGRDRSLGSNLELESSIVDTREVASTGRLVLLRLKSEGINVDTSGGDVGVGLVWLNEVEV